MTCGGAVFLTEFPFRDRLKSFDSHIRFSYYSKRQQQNIPVAFLSSRVWKKWLYILFWYLSNIQTIFKKQSQNTDWIEVLQNVSNREFWWKKFENLSKMGRLYGLTGRWGEKWTKTERSPRQKGRFDISTISHYPTNLVINNFCNLSCDLTIPHC